MLKISFCALQWISEGSGCWCDFTADTTTRRDKTQKNRDDTGGMVYFVAEERLCICFELIGIAFAGRFVFIVGSWKESSLTSVKEKAEFAELYFRFDAQQEQKAVIFLFRFTNARGG